MRKNWLVNVGACAAGIVCGSVAVVLVVLWGNDGIIHRFPPSPDGMICRIVTREAQGMSRIRVEQVSVNPVVLAIDAPLAEGRERVLYSFPSGDRLRDDVARDDPTSPFVNRGRFDFDGDGVEDALQIGQPFDYDVVRVLSGRDGSVLFEDDDLLEYENNERAFPLNDLDGDDCCELALVHPRMDRSYDAFFLDDWFGTRSWVTIISGSRATKR